MNALTASDQVLVPVIPDKTSSQAIPRLLEWLKVLKEKQICPELELAGILANCCHYKQKLTKQEQRVMHQLSIDCSKAWKSDVYFFSQMVPRKPIFAAAAEAKNFEALEAKHLGGVFQGLALELEKRVRINEGQPIAGVA